MSDQDFGGFLGALLHDIREQTQPVIDAAQDIKGAVINLKEDVGTVQQTLTDTGKGFDELTRDIVQPDNASADPKNL